MAAAAKINTGFIVRLSGLKAKPELNGRLGLVKSRVPGKARWNVQLCTCADDCIALKVSEKGKNLGAWVLWCFSA